MDGDPARGRLEILIVDDEPLQREAIRLCIDEEYGVSEAAWDTIRDHRWPGNIRELRNAVERAVILCDAPTVPRELLPFGGDTPEHGDGDGRLIGLREMEKRHIEYVLSNTSSIEEAAETLGVAPSTLWRKRRKYDR